MALNLTMPEFISGYTEMMNSPSIDPVVRSNMMKFLKLLMEDVTVRPWPQVRHYHMTVIQEMEAGLLSWGDTEQMLVIQRQHARTAAPVVISAPRRPNIQPRQSSGNVTPMVCPLFQTNSCEHATDHNSPRGFVQHICSYCLHATGRAINSHGESECRRRKSADESKNSSMA